MPKRPTVADVVKLFRELSPRQQDAFRAMLDESTPHEPQNWWLTCSEAAAALERRPYLVTKLADRGTLIDNGQKRKKRAIRRDSVIAFMVRDLAKEIKVLRRSYHSDTAKALFAEAAAALDHYRQLVEQCAAERLRPKRQRG